MEDGSIGPHSGQSETSRHVVSEGKLKKVKSCEPCRKRKVKCQPVKDGSGPYPCARCVRMKLQCEDPRFAEANMDEVSTRMYNMIKLARVIGQQPDLTLERIKSLLGTFTCLYRRRVLGGRCPVDGPFAAHVRELMQSLLQGLGMDLEQYLSTLTGLDGPDGVMIDGHHFTNQGSRGQQLHPFVAELYHETASTIGAISVHGEVRFVVNRSFERSFFTEAEAQRMLDEEDVIPPVVISAVFDPNERPRWERILHEMLVESRKPATESIQIFKVRVLKLGVTVMAMLRSRLMLLDHGSYFAMVFALTPLPMHATAPRRGPQGDRRAVLHCLVDSDPWAECAKVFGDWDAPTQWLGPPEPSAPCSTARAPLPLLPAPSALPFPLPLEQQCVSTLDSITTMFRGSSAHLHSSLPIREGPPFPRSSRLPPPPSPAPRPSSPLAAPVAVPSLPPPSPLPPLQMEDLLVLNELFDEAATGPGPSSMQAQAMAQPRPEADGRPPSKQRKVGF